ncbi:MAG: hypothetical protein J5982_05180 [Bacilli bacterium]|nr:hypothetical protein [Bacilli bacterium]
MAKGWNFDYLTKMSEEYKYLSEIEENQEKKELYEEICDLYQSLMLKLLFQEGEVYYSDVTTECFLDEYNGINNLHIYPRHYDRIMNRFALEVESLPKIIIPNYRRKIPKDESFDIVGMFIKFYFGDYGYELYKSNILEKPEYILYDHIDNVSSVTSVGEEKYLTICDFDDIRFTSALAHEAGHIAKSVINDTSSSFSPLGEFESFSYQIRLLIFMINRGIYSRDALKELLSLMKLAEKVSIVKRYNSINKLNNIKDPNYFDKRIEELNLRELAGIKETRDIYDSIASVLDKDYTKYIYSLLAVFGELTNPEYLTSYYDIVNNLGYDSQKSLVRRNNISVNRGMENYKQLRSELMRLI